MLNSFTNIYVSYHNDIKLIHFYNCYILYIFGVYKLFQQCLQKLDILLRNIFRMRILSVSMKFYILISWQDGKRSFLCLGVIVIQLQFENQLPGFNSNDCCAIY